jgi:outer membrane protein TolC
VLQREFGFRIAGFSPWRVRRFGFASLVLTSLVFAITPAEAQLLTFDEVVSRSLLASYDIRLTEADVKLNKNDILRKRTDFLPNIVAHMNSEYLRDLTNDQTQVAVVNNTIIPNTTRNQTSINLATSWNVIDFGARSKAVLAAKEHHIASRFAVEQRRRDIKLAVIDKYTDALIAFKNVGNKAQVLALRRGVFVCKARLFDAGNVAKTEVAEAELASADAHTALIHAQYDYVEKLKELSEYTHDIYNVDSTEVADYNDATPQIFEKIVLDRTQITNL